VPEGVFTFRNIPLLEKFFLKSYLNKSFNLGFREGFFYIIKRVGGVAFYKTGFQAGMMEGLKRLKSVATLIKFKK
jgi:hypothetical protein